MVASAKTRVAFAQDVRQGWPKLCALLQSRGGALVLRVCKRLAIRSTGLVGKNAAMFGQEADQNIHAFQVGTVEEVSSLSAAGHEFSVDELS